MGYTRSWERTDKAYDEDFINQVQRIIAKCQSLGISIKGGFGSGNPEVSINKIWLNGNEELGTDYETFAIINIASEHYQQGYDFCKTARKPYDYAVREILKIAEEQGIVVNVSEDGENNKIISDEEYIMKILPKWIYWKGNEYQNNISSDVLNELKDIMDNDDISGKELLQQCKKICEKDKMLAQIYVDYIKNYNITE